MFNLLKNLLGLTITLRVLAIPSQEKCISPISWSPCTDDARFDCASFNVPLDYQNPQNGDAVLALARLKSQNPDSRGSILTNPGGPGGSGVDFLISRAGDLISNITNGEFDVISWDPRGVDHSRPLITCGFSTAESFQDFFGDSIIINGVEARGNFTDQDDIASFFSKVNQTDSLIVKAGQKCAETNGDFLPFMDTVSTVRDMVSIWDCVEKPGSPLNYWGFSYGTVIGGYFVNIFPERVGRVIMDGVVDVVRWATEPTVATGTATQQAEVTLNDADATLLGFAELCAEAGPANCSLAQANSTGFELLSEAEILIDTAFNLTQLGLGNITSFDVREFLWQLMFFPTVWSDIGVPEIEAFVAATESEVSSLMNSPSRRRSLSERGIPASSDTIIDPTVASFVSELAITCIDSIDQPEITTQFAFETVLNVTQQISPIFGEVLVNQPPAFCHRFPIRATERFTGPFNHSLAFPVLVIGNKADPVTPFIGAQKMANLLGSSARLIKQDGFGHTSIAMNSDCTQSIVRDYFFTGALPESGVVCPTDQAVFPPNITIVSINALDL